VVIIGEREIREKLKKEKRKRKDYLCTWM